MHCLLFVDASPLLGRVSGCFGPSGLGSTVGHSRLDAHYKLQPAAAGIHYSVEPDLCTLGDHTSSANNA